jgi:uncharacterized protein (TIGR02246 family)
MRKSDHPRRGRIPVSVGLSGMLFLSACHERNATMRVDLRDLAARYAAAWSSQDPGRLAAFYADSGTLVVNAGVPSVGRAAIRTTVQSFMAAFPDMVVRMDSVLDRGDRGDRAEFHWTWTGTNTGPGGTGRAVRITGYEEWTFGPDGLIRESRGHYDDAEYHRQVDRVRGQT